MSESIMLRAKLINVPSPKTENNLGYTLRECRIDDINALGKLYFHSYDARQASENEDQAILDIESSFEGEYGSIWLQSSKLMKHAGKTVGAILTVHKNSWDDKITCPYIIELFVHRDYRKKGIAKTLILSCCEEVRKSGQDEIALTVVAENSPARNLYKSIGFQEQNI